MAASGKEDADFKDDLLRRGVPQEEIKKVYKTLRGRGYGDEEARRRSRAAYQKLKTQKELEERRQAAPPRPTALRMPCRPREPPPWMNRTGAQWTGCLSCPSGCAGISTATRTAAGF